VLCVLGGGAGRGSGGAQRAQQGDVYVGRAGARAAFCAHCVCDGGKMRGSGKRGVRLLGSAEAPACFGACMHACIACGEFVSCEQSAVKLLLRQATTSPEPQRTWAVSEGPRVVLQALLTKRMPTAQVPRPLVDGIERGEADAAAGAVIDRCCCCHGFGAESGCCLELGGRGPACGANAAHGNCRCAAAALRKRRSGVPPPPPPPQKRASSLPLGRIIKCVVYR